MPELFFQETKKSDLGMILSLEMDKENAPYIFANSKKEHKNLISDSDVKHFLLKFKSGETIGFVILAGLENKNKSIELRRIVIHDKGKGYGRQAIQKIKKTCFHELKCHRLWLDVLETNDRARHLYRSEGFVREGVFRESIQVKEQYLNQIFMSILESEYQNTIIP
jgi:RimJ/RimL family protein N-acetyltransferase